MLRAVLTVSLLAIGATQASSALAADNGIYIGGSVGQANIKDREDVTGLELDGDDTGFKAIVGFRPLDFLGFELNYVDLGQSQDTVAGIDLTADAKGIDAFAVGFIGLPFMDLFAKAGVIAWDAEVSAAGLGSLSDDGQDFAWGLGAQVRFGSAAIRAEYEKFEIGDLDDVNLISVGFTWTFL